MENELDNFYLSKDESIKSCLLAMRDIILSHDHGISSAWKYGMPFFCYKNKMFCYLWVHKKLKLPYIGFVEGMKLHHPKLIQEKRSRMKIILFDPDKDLPVKQIKALLRQALALYKTREIKVQ